MVFGRRAVPSMRGNRLSRVRVSVNKGGFGRGNQNLGYSACERLVPVEHLSEIVPDEVLTDPANAGARG